MGDVYYQPIMNYLPVYIILIGGRCSIRQANISTEPGVYKHGGRPSPTSHHRRKLIDGRRDQLLLATMTAAIYILDTDTIYSICRYLSPKDSLSFLTSTPEMVDYGKRDESKWSILSKARLGVTYNASEDNWSALQLLLAFPRHNSLCQALVVAAGCGKLDLVQSIYSKYPLCRQYAGYAYLVSAARGSDESRDLIMRYLGSVIKMTRKYVYPTKVKVKTKKYGHKKMLILLSMKEILDGDSKFCNVFREQPARRRVLDSVEQLANGKW